MRATIDRLRALGDGPVLVDGAIDRVAALAGGDDAVIVATGAASGATLARVAAVAADAVARLTLPGRDPARERARVDPGRRCARRARRRDAARRGARMRRSSSTTRPGSRSAARSSRKLRATVDLRCEHPLRVVACTTSPVGRESALPPRALVEAVARATGLPTFDVVADLAPCGAA